MRRVSFAGVGGGATAGRRYRGREACTTHTRKGQRAKIDHCFALSRTPARSPSLEKEGDSFSLSLRAVHPPKLARGCIPTYVHVCASVCVCVCLSMPRNVYVQRDLPCHPSTTTITSKGQVLALPAPEKTHPFPIHASRRNSNEHIFQYYIYVYVRICEQQKLQLKTESRETELGIFRFVYEFLVRQVRTKANTAHDKLLMSVTNGKY